MIIGAKMAKSINDQIQAELESAYLYLSMGTWLEDADMPGCAHWMKKQAGEEQEHAMRFFDYLVSRGGRVILQAIPAPKNKWKNATEIFTQVLAHEEMVTGRIYAMAELAAKEKDHATQSMLKWFIDEQVEEEETAMQILATFKKLGENPISSHMLDKELGAR